MREILIRIPDDKYSFLMKLLKSFSFEVEAKPIAAPKSRKMTLPQQEWVDEIREALQEAKMAEEGKIKLKPARQLLDELRG